MATRCTIAVDDRAVYCHFDGYPENTGRILNEHYRDKEKANELIDKGDMSSLGETLETTEFYNAVPNVMTREEADAMTGISYRYTYNNDTCEFECTDIYGKTFKL